MNTNKTITETANKLYAIFNNWLTNEEPLLQILNELYNSAIDDAENVPQEMRGEGENDLRSVAARIRALKIK